MAVAMALSGALLASPSAHAQSPQAALAHIHGVALDPSDPKRVYLATHHGLYLASPESGPEGGARLVSNARDDLMGFSAHPSRPREFFASGHKASGGNLGFVQSVDSGRTWQTLSPGAGGPVDFHHIAVSRSDPAVIYGVFRGLQQSTDGGRNWTAIAREPAGLIGLAVSATSSTVLYGATEAGLLISADGGRTWQSALALRRPATMVHTTGLGAIYAYFAGHGLMRAEGDGRPWRRLGALEGDRVILHFAAGSERFFAVSQHSEVFWSEDQGQTWRPYGG